MKILLIGNGFDLAHGLPTAYKDFLKYCTDIMYILVREYRCSGGTETASPVEGNR